MKLKIIKRSKRSTCEEIEIYSLQGFSMLDFQEWKEQNEGEITINLAYLLDTATNLKSMDPETQEPVSDSREVDFYLPNPLIEKVFAQLKKPQEDTEEVSESSLKASTVLSAIVTEILQNYHPHSEYEVRISDG